MTASLNVNDAGTWRKMKSLWVNDSATWRSMKSLWVNDSGTWRQIFSAGIDYTLVANGSATANGGIVGKGFNSVLAQGSPTPHGSLTGAAPPLGANITVLYDITSTSEAYLEMGGFASDPGSGYLISVTNVTNGVTRLATAATYNWLGSGFARWYWTPGPTPWGFVGGSTYALNIVFA